MRDAYLISDKAGILPSIPCADNLHPPEIQRACETLGYAKNAPIEALSRAAEKRLKLIPECFPLSDIAACNLLIKERKKEEVFRSWLMLILELGVTESNHSEETVLSVMDTYAHVLDKCRSREHTPAIAWKELKRAIDAEEKARTRLSQPRRRG